MNGTAITRIQAFLDKSHETAAPLFEIYGTNAVRLFRADLGTLLSALSPKRHDNISLLDRLRRMRSEWEADGGESGPPTIQGEMLTEIIFALTDPSALKEAFHAGQDAATMRLTHGQPDQRGGEVDAARVLDDIVPLSISSTWDAAERRAIVRAMLVFAAAPRPAGQEEGK